ncbi:MAG: ABC-2 transporter permease [Solobacterium sp.]|nr:ABC-2 transporter permease [Solobacterium sp.]
MKGLFYKDVLVLLRKFRTYIPMGILFVGMGGIMEDGMFWAVYGVMFTATMVSSLMADEENTGWNDTASYLPLSARTQVSEKYVFSLLCILSFIVVYTAAAMIGGKPLYEISTGLVSIVMTSEIVFLFSLPFTIMFGVQKSGLIRLIVTAVLVFFGITVLQGGQGFLELLAGKEYMMYIILLGTTALYFLSWYISIVLKERVIQNS